MKIKLNKQKFIKSYYLDDQKENPFRIRDKRSRMAHPILSRSLRVPAVFLKHRALVHNGLEWKSILIRKAMVGSTFGSLVPTKKLGSQIHEKKKKREKNNGTYCASNFI